MSCFLLVVLIGTSFAFEREKRTVHAILQISVFTIEDNFLYFTSCRASFVSVKQVLTLFGSGEATTGFS